MIIKNLLSKEQKDFIKKYQISEDLLIDAKGQELSEELRQEMAAAKAVLALNASGCELHTDHNFKNIDGECMQCEPDRIPFALRTYKTGYIYIAGSMKGHLIKVGSSNETRDLIKTLNITSAKSAGFDDWELILQAKTSTLGQVERMFQEKLKDYKSSAHYEKGKLQNGGEVYRCSYHKAKEAMTGAEGEQQFIFTQVNEKKHLITEYLFKNLKSKTQAL